MAKTLDQSQAYIEDLIEVERHEENFFKEFSTGVVELFKDTPNFLHLFWVKFVNGEWWDFIKEMTVAIAIGLVVALIVGIGGWTGIIAILIFVGFDIYFSIKSGKSLGYSLGYGITVVGVLLFMGSLRMDTKNSDLATGSNWFGSRAGSQVESNNERALLGEEVKNTKEASAAVGAKKKRQPSMEVIELDFESLPDHVQRSYTEWTGGTQKDPQKLKFIGRNDGVRGNIEWRNDYDQLPSEGSITYREYDVKISKPGSRDAEKFVVGSDGTVYYTHTHYGTSGRPAFIEIKF